MGSKSAIGKIKGKDRTKTTSTSGNSSAETTPAVKREFVLPHQKGIQRAAKVLNKSEEELSESVIHSAPADQFVVFKYNARDFDKLTIEKCSDVIESIKANDQQVPAIVRKNDEDQLEVIAGSRRLFSVRHLSLPLKYILVEANNRQAFQISDLENEKRQDTSPWEKYISYSVVIDDEYEGVQKEFALDNNISAAKLSRLMAFGKISSSILDAYKNRNSIPETHPSMILGLITKEKGSESLIGREATKIINEQYDLTPEQILLRFKNAANEAIRAKSKTGKKLAKPIIKKSKFGSSKKAVAEIKVTPTKITTIKLNKDAWATKEEAIDAVTALMRETFGDD